MSLRIVVADDEEYVRDLVVKNINRYSDRYIVTGVCGTGSEALTMINEEEPDVLITDICMPEMDGLELIKNIGEAHPNVKTVIISGYDKFEYAKSAVQLGVKDYLLKPFLPRELKEVLDRIYTEIENRNNLESNIREMENKLAESMIKDKDRALLEFLKGNSERTDIADYVDISDFAGGNLLYCIGVSKAESDMTEPILALLQSTAANYFEENIRAYFIAENDGRITVLFVGKYKAQMVFRQKIKEGFTRLSASLIKYYESGLNLALGNAYSEPDHIVRSYKEAVLSWKCYLDQSDNVLMYEEKSGSESVESFSRPAELEKKLMNAISLAQTDNALAALESIMNYYSQMPEKMMDHVSLFLAELVFTLSGNAARAGADVSSLDDDPIIDYLKMHISYGTLKEAKTVLGTYIERICECYKGINEKQSDKVVNNIRQLIEDNLANEELSLESVSAELFFSPNYVRQIFKSKTGESFKEYLIRRRMEVAADMLSYAGAKVCDVAVATGYSNQRYFASSFKKYYGCTPSEYLDMKTGEKENE